MRFLFQRAKAEATCTPNLEALLVESSDSPFFEHYHQLLLPVAALIKPPAAGLRLNTTVLDRSSYDVAAFENFVASSKLQRENLLNHSHEVLIGPRELHRIGNGEKSVEIRVISPAGNYVHNFKITALASTLVKVRKGASS